MKKFLDVLRQIVGWVVVLFFVMLSIMEFTEKGYLSGSLFVLVAVFNIPQVQRAIFKGICKITKSEKKAKNYILTVALQIVSLIICFTAILSSPMGKSDDIQENKLEETTKIVEESTTKKEKPTEAVTKETKKPDKKRKPKKDNTISESTTNPKNVVHTEVSFAEIYKEFKANKVRAEDKYNGKKFRITAKINGMETGGILNLTGGATLTMEKQVDNTIVFFYAEFEKEQEEKLKKVNVGDTVTFVGKCYGGSFTDCELE